MVITVTCRALLCHTCTLLLRFSIPKPVKPPIVCLYMGFLFIKLDIQITFLCAFFFKIWNLLLPVYTSLHLPLSDFFFLKPWASDGFEICHEVIKQEAEVYSKDEDSQILILGMCQYVLSTTQCYQTCYLKQSIGMSLTKSISLRIVLMSAREGTCYYSCSLRLEGWEDGNVSMLK